MTTAILRRAGLGAMAGITIGISLELIFSAFNGTGYTPGVPSFLEQFANANAAVLIERVLYVVLGVCMALGSQLFDDEHRSLTGATAMHFLTVMVPLGITALILHWAPSLMAMLLFLAGAVVIYAIIWFIIWMSISSQVKAANAELSRRNQSQA